MSILKSIEVRTYLVSLMILVSSIIVLSEVLFRNGLVFYGDFSFPITIERCSYVFQMPSPYPNMMFTYMVPFFAFASALHFSIETLVKLMLLAGLFLTGFSTYLAVNKILKDVQYTKKARIALASLVASYFYMFNPWSMDRVEHYFIWTSYALAPLILLLAIKLTQQDKLNYELIFLTSIVWSISSTSPFGALSNTMLLFSWILYSTVLTALSRQYSKIAIYFKMLVLTSSLYLLFNAHWILPYITSSMTQNVKPQYLLSWQTVERLSRNSNFPNVIRLVAYWWPQVQYWPNPPLYIPWILAGLILPLSALTALLIRKNKYTFYFSFMCILSILLSMGSNGPFPQMYRWIVFDAPFSNAIGWVFRDPNKWNSLTALAYSFLLGISLSEILSLNFKRININFVSRFRYSTRHLTSVLIVLLIVLSLTLYVGPTVYAHFTQIYTPVNVPKEYYSVNDWLKKQNGDFRVLWLAPLSHGTHVNGLLRYSWAPDKPYTSGIDSWSSAKPSMAPATNEAKRYTDFLYKAIMEGYVDKYLASLGVKYIIYHNDILGAETQGQLDIENLMTQKELKLVRREGSIYVFEMQSYTSRIFIPSKTLLVVGGLDSLTMLDSIPPLNFNDISILFLEQKFYGTSILNITKEALIINKDVVDLALSFLDKKYVVAPFEYTIHDDPSKDWAKTNVYEHWWNWPSPKNLTGFWDWDYGMGLVKTTIPNAKLDVPYSVDYADTYGVWVRYLESPLGGEISISADKNNIRTIDTLGDRGFKWFKAKSISLNAGKHDLILENVHGFNAVNLIALVPTSVQDHLFDLVRNLNILYVPETHATQTEKLETDKLFKPEKPAQINYIQKSSSEWTVHVNATKPFVLGFTESYDPFWTIYPNEVSTKNMPLYSVINGFFINKTGYYTLIIGYEPQKYFNIGLWITALSIMVSALLFVILPKWRLLPHFRRSK